MSNPNLVAITTSSGPIVRPRRRVPRWSRGKIDASTPIDKSDFRAISPRFAEEARKANKALVDLLKRIAGAKGATPAQIALAWLLARAPFIVPNGARLTQRASFAEWQENVTGRAVPFTTSEVRVAETLRATLIEVVLRLADEAAAERRQSTARQEMLIAELNHRVRNILGVIRGLIRQSQPNSTEVKDFVRLVMGASMRSPAPITR